ncbi:MAG: glycosyltransferase involved in cell wall biosynthesis [Mariniflexile sp.]|jgi:glycosyltransferase involved in cell wall biosynthesis
MSKQPFFSVVISLYNKERYIENTLKSVLNQTFTDFEIIIVDDGSIDESYNIVNAINDPRINLFTIKNQGASFTRNYGIKKADAYYIALLDGDDLWHKNHLETIFCLIEEFPNAGMYSNGYHTLLNNKYIKKPKLKGIPYNYKGIIKNYFKCNLYNSIVNSSVVVIPKYVFEDIGLFDVDLKSGQDTYLWTQIALKYKVAINNTVTATIIKNDNSLSTSHHIKDRILFLYKFIEQEKTNKYLKKFMDMNRYALALNFKMNNQNTEAKSIFNNINSKNISIKQKIIFYLPNSLIKTLYKIKMSLDKKGFFFHLYR